MKHGGPALVVALTLAAALPATARAQSPCGVVLNGSVVLDPGEQRACDVFVVGHDVTIARAAVLDGGVTVVSGNAAIDGTVSGSVNVVGGDAAVSGRVDGDVFASGVVRLRSGASIEGDVTGGEIQAADGVEVDGTRTEVGRGWAGLSRSDRPMLAGGGLLLVQALVTFLLALAFGALATRAAPAFVARLVARAEPELGATLAAALTGFGVLVGSIGLAVVLRRSWASGLFVALPVLLATIGALGIGGRLGGRLAPRLRPGWRSGLGLALVAVAATLALQVGSWALFCLGAVLVLALGAWAIGVAVLATAAALRRPGIVPTGNAVAAPPPAAPVDLDALERIHSVPEDADAAPPPDTRSQPVAAPTSADAVPDASAPVGIDASATAPPADDASTAAPPADDASTAAPPADDASATAPPADDPSAAALDLRRIPGITPIYAHVLGAAGIQSLVELAEREPDEIVASLDVPGVLGIDRATAELWVAMARRRLGR